MENINAAITHKIEEQKDRFRTSYGAIAESAGMSLTQFNRKRNGGKDWTATEVARIAEFFRIPFTSFFPDQLTTTKAAA
ncbi:helix-turn-helix domain-containing protein [Glutamicibacter soli]